MKKLLLMMIAVATTFVGCTGDNVNEERQELTVVAVQDGGSAVMGSGGGTYSVEVTSSDIWGLTPAEDYDWVQSDLVWGNGEGDVVTFSAIANPDDAGRKAIFTFQCGSSRYVVEIRVAGDKEKFFVMTPPVVSLNSDGPEFGINPTASYGLQIELTNDLSWGDLTTSIETISGGEWVAIGAYLVKGNTVTLYLDYSKNATLFDRTATFTIKDAFNNHSVNIEFIQSQKDILTSVESMSTVPADEGSFSINISTNTEYEVTFEQTGNWMSLESETLNSDRTGYVVRIKHAAQPQGADVYVRDGYVVFTQSEPREGREPLEFRYKLTQTGRVPYISSVIDMRANFATPFGVTNANSFSNPPQADVLNNLTEFTLESLVYIIGFKGTDNQSFMGLEGEYLLRFEEGGDKTKFEIAPLGIDVVPAVFPLGVWTHVAVTYDQTGTTKVYLDGKLLKSEAGDVKTYNFGKSSSTAPWGSPHVFTFGGAVDDKRWVNGNMAEARIWNKALTMEEINAPRHFYRLDNPETIENLVGYWKMDKLMENETKKVEDLSINDNHLNFLVEPKFVEVWL